MRFRLVCPQLRYLLPPSPPDRLPPLLMLSCTSAHCHTLISDATQFHLPQDFQRSRCIGPSHGWVVVQSSEGLTILSNPFSRPTIPLPPLETFLKILVLRGGAFTLFQTLPWSNDASVQHGKIQVRNSLYLIGILRIKMQQSPVPQIATKVWSAVPTSCIIFASGLQQITTTRVKLNVWRLIGTYSSKYKIHQQKQMQIYK